MKNPTLNIIAFDPGGTTGYATYTAITGKINFSFFDYSEQVDNLIQPNTIVVYENPFKSVRVDPIVFEVKGAIVERANSKGCKLIPQIPNNKEFIKKAYKLHDKLKVDHKDHSRDACAHLMYFMMKEYSLTPEQFFELIPKNLFRLGK